MNDRSPANGQPNPRSGTFIPRPDSREHSRLGELMSQRRQELRLSQTQAATLAEVARNTWSTAEAGARAIREHNYAGIERALRWAPGSVAAILTGGEPTTLPPAEPAAQADIVHTFNVQVEIERVSHLEIPAAARLALIRRILDLHDEAVKDAESDQHSPP